MLEGLSAAGFRLTASRTVTEPELERAGRREAPDRPNRFFFEKITGECVAEVLVCYEPVVRLGGSVRPGGSGNAGTADGFESGVEKEDGDAEERFAVRLVRTSVLSPAEGGGLKVVTPEEAFFTPDFVVRVSVRRGASNEKNEENDKSEESVKSGAPGVVGEAGNGGRSQRSSRSRWFVADAKYSGRSKTVLERTMDTACKYLLAMSPIRPEDTLEGVWLFYAWEEARGAFAGNSLRTHVPEGLPNAPDVHYECAGLGDGDSGFVRAVLAACEEMAKDVV